MILSIPETLKHLKEGNMIIIIDNEDRENEDDFYIPAEFVTPEIVNFMATHGRGLICIAITSERAEAILPFMVVEYTETHATAFTVSVDFCYDEKSTDISAFDRALTIQQLINPDAQASDFKRPGHMFPLIAKDAGVLECPGHTKAAVDLARMIESL